MTNTETVTEPIVRCLSAEEVHGEAKKIFDQIISSGKKVPKWVEVMAKCEDILAGFFMMFKATMDDALLPALLKWKVADAVSHTNQCDFCVDVTHMQLRQFGLDDEAIAKISETTDERERAALASARAVSEKAYEIDPAVTVAVRKPSTTASSWNSRRSSGSSTASTSTASTTRSACSPTNAVRGCCRRTVRGAHAGLLYHA